MADEEYDQLPTPSHSQDDHVAKIVSEIAKLQLTDSMPHAEPTPLQVNCSRQTIIATIRDEHFATKFELALIAFGKFASVTHVRAPTSPDMLQCGVDALSIALKAALQERGWENGFPTKEDLNSVILQAANAEEFVATQAFHQDLLSSPDRNFSYDQLALAVAGYGFAIGVVAIHGGEGGENIIFAEDQRMDKGDVDNANVLWLINECGHWEALVPKDQYDGSADEVEILLE